MNRLTIPASLTLLATLVCPVLRGQEANPALNPTPRNGDGVAPMPGFDVETGVWFPANVSAEEYLHNVDSYKQYVQDLQKVYKNDPEALKQVCDVVLSPHYSVNPDRLDEPARRLRMALVIRCEAVRRNVQMLTERAERSERHLRQLSEWFEEEYGAARKLTQPERRQRAQELRPLAFDMPNGDEKLRAAVKLIALRPADDFAAFLFLRSASSALLDKPEPVDPESDAGVKGFRARPYGLTRAEAHSFLSQLYSSRARDGQAEAGAWKGGLAAFLFLTGQDFKEARRLARESLDDPAADNPQYGIVFSSVLDKILGDPQPLNLLLANCPYTSSDPNTAAVSPNYCRVIAKAVASRGVQLLYQKSPPALVEILLESIRSEPANWPLRIDSISKIAFANPAAAEQELDAVLALPATAIPEEARFNALEGLQNVADVTQDYPRAIRVNDWLLKSAGFKALPLPPDAWQRLAATPKLTEKETERARPDFISVCLAARFHFAIYSNDLALARRTTEQFLAYRLQTGVPQPVRDWLRDVALAELSQEDQAGAIQILGYLRRQPRDPLLTSTLEDVLKLPSAQGAPAEIKPADRPWDAHPAAPTRAK